ncbi:MAG: hypothetical protein ABDK94_01195 [Atribacterota bacterium]
MKELRFFGLVVSVLALFLSLAGCGWFSDNPMFPRAKVSITGEVVMPSETFTNNLGLVKFTFTPLNKVGVQITQYRLEYKKKDGTALPHLTATLSTSIDVIPPDTPMASFAGTEAFSVTREIDLLPADVEAYLKSNRIPAVVVTITFSGVDYAMHDVSYEGGAFRFNMLEGLPSGLTLEFFCTVEEGCASCGNTAAANIGCALTGEYDVMVITKVEFYINGEPAGIDVTAPFVSDTVRMKPNDSVVGVALVHDINGGMSTVTNVAKVEEVCMVASPTPTPGP